MATNKSLEPLAVFSTLLGVLNYEQNLEQSSNDDIMQEVKGQTDKYLIKIVEQNEKIIEILEGLVNGYKENERTK